MPNEALIPKEEKAIEFIPFGSADKIKLSVKIIQNMVAVPTRTGRTCSERDALRFLMLCQAQRLNPFAGDAFLTGYDSKDGTPTFSLITAHSALLKRAEASPDYEGMESGIITHDENSGAISEREGDFHLPSENVVGAWARVHRKGRRPTYKRLAMEQRRPNYETPFWKGNKASEQLVKCAEADALRATFPTLLGGLYTQEEQSDSRASRMVSEMSNNRGAFEAKGLVESVPVEMATASTSKPEPEDDGDLGPQTPQTPAGKQEAPAADSAKAQLAALVTGEGFTFSHLQQWGVESGNISGADSLGGFDDVPEADAKRLLRAKTGLLRGLAQVKGGKEGE